MADQGTSQWRGLGEAGFSRVQPNGIASGSGAEGSLSLTSEGPLKTAQGSSVLERSRSLFIASVDPQNYTRDVGDIVSLSEALTVLRALGLGVAESAAGVSDALAYQVGVVPTITEGAASASDALGLASALVLGVSDTAPASDALTTTQTSDVAATEGAAAGTDSLVASVGIAVTGGDTATVLETLVTEIDVFVDVNEGVPVTEALQLGQVLLLGVAESVALAEAITTTIGSAFSVSDVATLVDTVGLTLARQLAVGDVAPVLEALSFVLNTSVVVGDTAAASDLVATHVGIPVSVAETVTLVESVLAQSVGIATVNSTTLQLTLPVPVQVTNVADAFYYRITPLDGGVPVRVEWLDPVILLGTVTTIYITISKPTNGKEYLFEVWSLQSLLGATLSFQARFVAVSSLPRVSAVQFYPEDGAVGVTFDDVMRFDRALTDPSEYTITGPTSVEVVSVRATDARSVLLDTLGFGPGSYQVTVNATGTPKDVAGNPTDPGFNQAIFTASTPLNARSIFVDRGPITKPPLTIQTGTGISINDPVTLTLTGGSLGPTVVGLYIILGANATNGGTFLITAWLAPTKIRVKANLHLPDVVQPATTWEVYDPRNGEIADDPADVVVRVNGIPVTPEAVIGLLGQVVLNAPPAPADDVQCDYSFICNPTVEVRRLNSKEFRLNAWNRDQGYPGDMGHHYRYNNQLIRPSDFEPADMQAKLAQPLQRDLKYRAYERAYSALLNDPNLLLLNSPHHHIAYPPLERQVASEFINYVPTALPEGYPGTPWERKGTGTAVLSFDRLVVGDDTGGPFPSGNPIFWARTIDLTFPHVYAATWQVQIDSVTTYEGVWTGIAAGFSDELKAIVVGYLLVGGVRKIGILRRGFGNDPSSVDAWAGGLDGSGNPTGLPVDLDWSTLHSFRIYQTGGVVRVFFDGEIIENLRLLEDDLPFLEELTAPFNQAQNSFFGSLSLPAINQSTWDFVRYLVQPINPLQTAPSIFVSYEGNDYPETATPPWTPVGYHGNETIVASYALQVDSTSATNAATEAQVGLVGGDFHGFIRLEPLLAVSSDVILDVNVTLLTQTHGITPNACMAAIDDGTRILQLCFFPDKASPKASYGGRSLPENFQPTPWTPSGTAPVEMFGRTLRISDPSIVDGRVYYWDDNAAPASDARIVAASTDYILEFQCRVQSYTPDPGGFCGAMGEVYDSSRALGLMLVEIAGVRYVAPHSDGVLLPGPVLWPFDWFDQEMHTYRLVKSGITVNAFVDGALLGTLPYATFPGVVGPASGTISWGSSTVASMSARSVVDWAYANVWRLVANLRHYVGFWKGTDPDQLTGYHLPLKTSGRGAVTIGNTLQDTAANFVAAGVLVGDEIVIDVGGNKGTYEILSVAATQLTIAAVWPVQPSVVTYRVPLQVDWTAPHKYRVVRSPDGSTVLLLDSLTAPLITIGYNEIDIPSSSVGLPRIIAGGLPSITWGAFDPTNLSSSLWDFVRYGITRSPTELRIAPHHQILNQRNVIASPEHLRTTIPHPHTDFWSSDVGIPPQTEPDFLKNPLLIAYTLLNEGTPLVPSTQSTEVQVPTPTTQFVSMLNAIEDVLNTDGDFKLNDGSVRHILLVPDDVLYTGLQVIETQTGEANLVAPFCDECESPDWGTFYWQKEVCLTYDGAVLPEDSGNSPAWVRVDDIPANVFATPFSGVLTYGTTGPTRTVYRNPTALPDSVSLTTEVKIRMKVVQDATLGLGDSQVRLGFSSTAGFTLSLAFVTTPLGERYVLVVDQNTLNVLGGIPFNWYDGSFHTYRMVREPTSASVFVYVDT